MRDYTILNYINHLHFKKENYMNLVLDLINTIEELGYRFKNETSENELYSLVVKKDNDKFSKDCFEVEFDTYKGKYVEFKTVYNMSNDDKIKKMLSKNKLIVNDETNLAHWMYNIYGMPKNLLLLEMICRINDIVCVGSTVNIPINHNKVFDDVRNEMMKTLLPSSTIESYYMKSFINLYNNLIVGKQINVDDETLEGFINTYFIK